MFSHIVDVNEENNPINLPYITGIDGGVSVPISLDNEQHEIEVVAVDGNAIVMWNDDNLSINSSSDTISVGSS